MVSEVHRGSCSHDHTNSSPGSCSHFDDIGCHRYPKREIIVCVSFIRNLAFRWTVREGGIRLNQVALSVELGNEDGWGRLEYEEELASAHNGQLRARLEGGAGA